MSSHARAYHVVLVAEEYGSELLNDAHALEALVSMAQRWGWQVLVNAEGEWWSHNA